MKRFLIKYLKGPNRIKNSKRVSVGKHSFHNGGLDIRGKVHVTIGSHCAFGKNIAIISENHDLRYLSMQGYFYKKYFDIGHPGDDVFPNPHKSKGPIEIGSDVWIGDKVIILSGVKIGDGAIVAAGSIVTKKVPSYGIAVGTPAKVIKYRYEPEIVEYLKNLKWWKWPEERIVKNKALFTSDLSNMSLDTIKSIVV